jgi:hypothetical protein
VFENVGGFVASCMRQWLHEWTKVCVTGLRADLDVLRCNEYLAGWVDDCMAGWTNA